MEGNSNHPDGCKCGVCGSGMNNSMGMNKDNCGNSCGACGCHTKFRGFFIIRMIMAILLALVIFWAGFMLGELHTFNWFNFRGASGYGMMGGFGGGSTLRVYHNNMMSIPPVNSTTPSPSATK